MNYFWFYSQISTPESIINPGAINQITPGKSFRNNSGAINQITPEKAFDAYLLLQSASYSQQGTPENIINPGAIIIKLHQKVSLILER